VWDSGAGASFISKRLARAVGARIRKAKTPMFFHGYSNDASSHSRVDEIATVSITAGTYTENFTCWVSESPPVPLLIGRDNQRSVNGHGCTMRTDDEAWVQFDGHDPVPAIPSLAAPPPPAALAVTMAANVQVRGNGIDWIDVLIPTAHNADVNIMPNTTNGIHVFDQTVSTGAHGQASILVHNTNVRPTDVLQHSAMASAAEISSAPLHPTTIGIYDDLIAMAAKEARTTTDNQANATSETNTTTTADGAAPRTTTTPALYTEAKPRSSTEVRGATWRGNAFSNHEEATAAFSTSLPTEAQLDSVLSSVIDDMEVGSPSQRKLALEMLRKHRRNGLFSTTENKHGLIKGHKASIKLSSNQPVFSRPFNSTPMQNEELCRQAAEMLADKLIKPTRSANNFPTLLVSKGEPKVHADGSVTQTPPRLTIDLRKLNPLIITEFFEIPSLRHMCDKLAASSLHSSFDLTSGYTQVELDDTDSPSSADMIAFTLPHCKHPLSGQRFSSTRLVMGMRDSMSRFSCILNAVLLAHGYVQTYVDDIFISNGKSGQDDNAITLEHIQRVDAVFTTLSAHGVKLSPYKLQIARRSIEALGHTIANNTVTVSRSKTEAIRNIKAPSSRGQLEITMGVLGVARRFMPAYAAVAKPLYDLLSLNWRKFKWENTHQRAFDEIKRRFEDTDALHAPNFDLPFEVHADASLDAAASMLTQRCPRTGISNIIDFHSHSFSTAERNYTCGERECLALILACKRWRPYLLSSAFTCVLRTDHAGITFIHRHAHCHSRLYRWCQQLSEFDYRIEWHPGTEMVIPDALSRSTIGFIHSTQNLLNDLQTPVLPITVTPAPPVYGIDRLVSEHRHTSRPNQKFFRVRWHGYPHPDQDTVEPLSKLRKDLTQQQLRTLRTTFEQRSTTTTDCKLHLPPGFQEYTNTTPPGTAPHDAPASPTGTPHTQPPAVTRTHLQNDRDNITMLDYDAPSDSPPSLPSSFSANTFPQQQLLPNLSISTIAAHQRADTRINAIINNITDNPGYSIHESTLLMRSYTPKVGPRASHNISTIVLPESLIPLALAATHTASGHHGETSTTFAVQTRFSFPNLYRRTQAYVKGCPDCSRAKRDLRPVHQGKIKVYGWLDVVSIDFAGPMRQTINGNRHMAIIVDHSTKHVHVHPCPSTSTADATAALLSFTQHCGIPGKVVSDRGAAFTSRAWAGLTAALNTTARTTTSYNPQGNSHAECQVGNIKGIIRLICQQHPRHWDTAARWAAWSYNQSYNSTIGTTPQFARTGREPRTIPDIVFNNPTASDSLTLTQLIQRVRAVHKTTQQRVEAMHDKFIAKNKSLHHTRSFATGDSCWLHRVYPGINRPAAGGQNKSFFWPFRPDIYDIVEATTKQHVKIRNRTTGITQHVHTRRLKPYRPQEDCFDFADLQIQQNTQ
jgi:hypothetical protein